MNDIKNILNYFGDCWELRRFENNYIFRYYLSGGQWKTLLAKTPATLWKKISKEITKSTYSRYDDSPFLGVLKREYASKRKPKKVLKQTKKTRAPKQYWVPVIKKTKDEAKELFQPPKIDKNWKPTEKYTKPVRKNKEKVKGKKCTK